MPVTDPIADMLTRVRNALMVQHAAVEMPSSKAKVSLADILKREGFIADYETVKSTPQDVLRLRLLYSDHKVSVITGLKRVSKPGLRIYKNTRGLPKVLGGLGVAIISTSKGVMSDRDARKQGVGGEVLCYVY